MTDISGWFSYKGTTCMQHKDVGDKLKILFENKKPSRVLEIGTASGGLTLLLRDVLDECNLENCDIRSYDVGESSRYHLLEAINNGARIDFRLENLFNHPYDDLLNYDDVPKYIQQEGVTIVMCDGGSKKSEFRIFSKYLKPGDIIMAHDYSSTVEYFENFIYGKIWNWCEIYDSDIENVVKEHNLEPYMKDEFQDVVWACKIKK